MHLSGLFLYPVKSLRGCVITKAEVDALGIVGDRRFLVVDVTGRFLTQRTLPRMALVKTALAAETLTLSAQGAGSVSVSRRSDPRAPLLTVSVWSSEGLQTEDAGDAAATWLTDFLGVKSRLVCIGDAFNRPLLKPGEAKSDNPLSFVDGYPFLLIGEASLAELNDRLIAQNGDSLPMNRFRPNLVVSGSDAFAEDSWKRLKIGSLIFRTAGPCTRCIITATDQDSAVRGKEPLRTLATYRRNAGNPSEVDFGQNLIHETKTGSLQVGDPVEPLDGRSDLVLRNS